MDHDPTENPPEKKHIFDNPRNVKRVIYVFFFLAAVLLLLDLVVHRHTEFDIEGVFGFYAFYGLIGSMFLVLSAKELRKILMRREDYYGDPK